jgi:phosphohistidine swiveling domain-containing protein
VARTVAFVLGPPRSGKSTAAAIVGELLCADVVETSTIIATSLERARGLEPGSYLVARAADPELHRGELGRWGSRMASRNGWSPARVGVARGFRVISGCRRLSELLSAEREAVRRGLEPWPIYVERQGAAVTDNTDAALRHHAAAVGSIVTNDADIEALAAVLARALDDWLHRRATG